MLGVLDHLIETRLPRLHQHFRDQVYVCVCVSVFVVVVFFHRINTHVTLVWRKLVSFFAPRLQRHSVVIHLARRRCRFYLAIGLRLFGCGLRPLDTQPRGRRLTEYQACAFSCNVLSPDRPLLLVFVVSPGRGRGVLCRGVVPDALPVQLAHALGHHHVAVGQLGHGALVQGACAWLSACVPTRLVVLLIPPRWVFSRRERARLRVRVRVYGCVYNALADEFFFLSTWHEYRRQRPLPMKL